MTPKEQYEDRKKERLMRQDALARLGRIQEAETVAFMDVADRFATAFERMADSLEHFAQLKQENDNENQR